MKQIFFLLFLVFSLGLSQAVIAEENGPFSAYTSLSDCQYVEDDRKSGPLGYVRTKCPSRDGYAVFIESADARNWLVLKKGEFEIDLQVAFLEAPFLFAYVGGDSLEWRYHFINGVKTLRAWIFRVRGTDPETSKDRSVLYVVRLEPRKGCVLGKVLSNEEARKLADSEQSCP